MLVGSTLSEGALIAAHLMESAVWTSEFKHLRERLQKESAEIRTLPGEKSFAWLTSKKGCAFLDAKNGDCRIYAVRPMACRTYYVTSSPEKCSPDKPGATVMVIDPGPAVAPVIQAILEKTLEEIPPITGSLQSMILAGIELISHSTLAKFKRWLARNPQIDDMGMSNREAAHLISPDP